jgi:hypothetical protein
MMSGEFGRRGGVGQHDAQGTAHEGTFFMSDKNIPPALEKAVAGGNLPVVLAIAYDPSWSGRNGSPEAWIRTTTVCIFCPMQR